jgi:hypothetical protein
VLDVHTPLSSTPQEHSGPFPPSPPPPPSPRKMKELLYDGDRTKKISHITFGFLSAEEMRRLSHVQVSKCVWEALLDCTTPRHTTPVPSQRVSIVCLSASRVMYTVVALCASMLMEETGGWLFFVRSAFCPHACARASCACVRSTIAAA